MGEHILQANWEPRLTLPQLPLKYLLELKIKALLLDVDGTLLPGRELVLPDSVCCWIEDARHHFELHLLSNNPSRNRIGEVARQLQLSFTCGAAKPRRAAIRQVLENMNFMPSEIAIIGDRVFTDVLAGNRIGLYTVLVRPLRSDGYPSSHDRIQRIESQFAQWLGAKYRTSRINS